MSRKLRPLVDCLIIVVVNGVFFASRSFDKGCPLILAGQQVVLAQKFNLEADRAYRRHFIEHNRANARQTRMTLKDLYGQVTESKYANASAFEAAYTAADEKLFDSIDELDQNTVPPAFHVAHKKLDNSYETLRESLEALKVAYYTHDPQKSKLAQAKLIEGCQASEEAENAMAEIVSSDPQQR